MSIRRILVATGDIALISFLEEELDRLGYRVIGPAATGRQAVEIALKQKPDAILMDVHLRGKKTGFQAAEEIRASAGIPVIYLAAPQDAQSLQRANGGDAFLCLSRPVGERELCVGLEMALFKHAAEQRLERLNQVLRAIRKVNKIIIRLDDPRRLLEEACQILVEMRSYRLVWIGHKKRGAARLQVLASAGQGCKLLRAFFTLESV